MFYSHEILTSRKHGVATVWLVATLGSKSSLKKVTRKAILDVDVPKACNVIVDPSAPMALRLQGNLLFGVSRVYSQQCGYVLSDLQAFRDKMKGAAIVFNETGIDPEAGRARADQLNLPDDPAFLPDLDMAFDPSLFDISTDSLHDSGIGSPFDQVSSQHSLPQNLLGDDEPALVFPLADSPSEAISGFDFGVGTSSAIRTMSNMGQLPVFEESGINENIDFDFDGEGNIIHLQPRASADRQSAALSVTGVAGGAAGDSGISARVRAEHEGGADMDELNRLLNFDDGIISLGDDEPLLPAAPLNVPTQQGSVARSEPAEPTSSAQPEEEDEASPTIEVQQRRVKPVKPLIIDQRTELTNKELSEWNANYLANMAENNRHKEQYKALALAKKNAAFWVLEQGIGGVKAAFGEDRVPHPLSIFSGQALLDALTGRESSPAGTKRSRSSDNEDDEEEGARRVRSRDDDQEQIGRGQEEGPIPFGDDDGIMAIGDYMPPSEVGRNAPPSLPDQSTQMPWNPSGSRHGSVRYLGSGLPGGMSSSLGGPGGGFELGPPSSLARRGSRLTSASPLQGKGSHLPRLGRISSLEIVSQQNLPSLGDNFDDEAIPSLGDLQEDEDFQLYGPAAAVDTQTAAQSQWVAATLENEALNFLRFLEKEIQEREADDRAMDDPERGTITFEQLLPPTENNNVVASQALLHVLALTTKGLVKVHQEEPFGHITITVVGELAEEEEDNGELHDQASQHI